MRNTDKKSSSSRKGMVLTGLVVLALFALVIFNFLRFEPTSMQGPSKESKQDKIRAGNAYGKLPLSFEVNQGQTDDGVEFLSRGAGYTLFLTQNEAVLSLKSQAKSTETIKMSFTGASDKPEVVGVGKQAGKVNYLLGPDPGKWRTGIPTYSKVSYKGIYPGIDLVYYGRQGKLAYDFLIKPSARVDQVKLEFAGAKKIEVDPKGNLIIYTASGKMIHNKPLAYQVIGKVKHKVQIVYTQIGNKVGFKPGKYDLTMPLVIDPTLVYSTYLGGNQGDSGSGIAVDGSGSAYVTGNTSSANFPTQEPLQSRLRGDSDAFITKLNPQGTALVYSTYLGGSGSDLGMGIALDGSGSAYVVGNTSSTNFPTKNALQGALKGVLDVFISKLTPDGSSLVYSTYLGGSKEDMGAGIAVDGLGAAYITGSTFSTNFPTRKPIQATLAGSDDDDDAFVAKINPAGSALVYSTYLGGNNADSGNGIAVDAGGSAYITGATASTNFPTENPLQAALRGGMDAFISKINVAGSALVYSTYLGGSQPDSGNGIAVDTNGAAYVAGETSSNNFPTKNALQANFGGGVNDAFISKINPIGSSLTYSTYLGGSKSDFGTGIALDVSAAAYVTGSTASTNFPTRNAVQTSYGGGTFDAFASKVRPAGSALNYSTYLGGRGLDNGFGIDADGNAAAYVTGSTDSANFPTRNPFQKNYGGGISDVFVSKISS